MLAGGVGQTWTQSHYQCRHQVGPQAPAVLAQSRMLFCPQPVTHNPLPHCRCFSFACTNDFKYHGLTARKTQEELQLTEEGRKWTMWNGASCCVQSFCWVVLCRKCRPVTTKDLKWFIPAWLSSSHANNAQCSKKLLEDTNPFWRKSKSVEWTVHREMPRLFCKGLFVRTVQLCTWNMMVCTLKPLLEEPIYAFVKQTSTKNVPQDYLHVRGTYTLYV